MSAIEQSKLAALIRETRQWLDLSQVKFAEKRGVSFQRVNCWEQGRTKPMPIALKQIELLLQQMGEQGANFLAQYL
ncbi:helix-turn-helix domain-containing protein [Oscillatoria sp. FACHB-1407]|uniref:helix-turn-helix domain-containing protein n=1 Tax=Oscillatoria sp. FACHB-1407 TaxID=2692847 RepID=UPI001686F8A0|nr:helix-turn-helix domain-containing protein [Oscillatoria sp. FACHB-1407]MBD2465746.1 helix-turn-helix domain-containing protein [Oscillatoria sp. FACHB-1407]